MSPAMAETACVAPYSSNRDLLAPFSSGPFVNGNTATYSASNGGGGAATPTRNSTSGNGAAAVAASNMHQTTSAHYTNGSSLASGLNAEVAANSNGSPTVKGVYASAMNGSSNGVLNNTANPHKASLAIASSAPAMQTNGFLCAQPEAAAPRRPSLWYEEEIEENLRWCFGLTSILHTGVSKFQEIALLDTQPFGKVLTLDRKMQSAEMDEWVYHECLVHPALLLHQSPKTIFVAGGGEGSTAREALRHRSVRKVVMCDIDEEVVKFCSAHLTVNKEAFQSSRLELVINCAKAELKCREEKFDVIIGDLADPLEWGPCYQLYSIGFYQNVVKPKLNHGGIFVTQAGPAGVLSHKEVFTSIYNTLRNVFTYVVAYSAHVPSYADTWGWVVASDQPMMSNMSSEELDCRIKQRIKGELKYLDGATLYASTILNKTVRQSLENEKHVYTEESARFVYGHGRNTSSAAH